MAPAAWVVATGVACAYGLFKEMRPSEPFLTPYLTGPDKNLTEDQVNSHVYPVWTYSYLVALVPVFLLTDLLRYKPVVIFEGVAYVITWALLLWGQGVLVMQFMQFVYGLATATEIAYYSYIYAVVETERYQQVTSYTRGAVLFGRFASGALGQALVSSKATSYYGLTCISAIAVSIAACIALFFPSVKRSVYFYHTRSQSIGDAVITDTVSIVQTESSPSVSDGVMVEGYGSTEPDPQETQEERPAHSTGNDTAVSPRRGVVRRVKMAAKKCCVQNFGPLLDDFRQCYGNKYLLKWSIWWAIATCGNFQVGNYVQNLWQTIYESRPNPQVYNGAVEAAATLLGAIVVLLLSLLKANWKVFGELFIGVVSIVDAILLLAMALTPSVWVAYSTYVIFRASYQMVITIASFQIASQLTIERYALVFGCNTFLALLLETILTAVVVDHRGLHVRVRIQFIINGSYFLLMGLIFLAVALYGLRQIGWRRAWRVRRGEPYVELDA